MARARPHFHGTQDVVYGTMATARLGSGTADATTFLRGDSTWAVPASGGAPTDAQYLVLALDGTLTAERRLVVSAPLSIADGGANGDATLSLAVDDSSLVLTGRAFAGPPRPHFHDASAIVSGLIPAARIQEVLALADLSDVTAKTGTGTIVVMDTSPTIVTPTIASFTNATHSHQNAAGGGTLVVAAINFTDTDFLCGRSAAGAGAGQQIVCTSAAREFLSLNGGTDRQFLRWFGGLPSYVTPDFDDIPDNAIALGTPDGTKFLDDTRTWRTPPGMPSETDSVLTIRTFSGPPKPHFHDARDVVHGTMATARLGSGTADNTTFLRGDSTWAVPAGGGGAPTDAQYLVLALNGTLTGERRLVVSSPLAIADGGADGDATLSIDLADTGLILAGQVFSGPPRPHFHGTQEIVYGTMTTARLGSGTADSTRYLRGDSTWQLLSGVGASVAHDTLVGLGDDDHVQYLLVDGTRASGGQQEFSVGILIGDGQPVQFVDTGTGGHISVVAGSIADGTTKTVTVPHYTGTIALLEKAQSWTGAQQYGIGSGPTFQAGSVPTFNADSFFNSNITIENAVNIVLGIGTGTKIGTTASSKLGFHGATPTIKQGATSDIKDVLVTKGLLTDGNATPLNLDSGALTCGAASVTGLDMNNGAITELASIDSNGAADIIVKRNAATNFTIQDKKLLFEATTTDVYLSWPATGTLALGVGSEDIATLTATTLVLKEVAADTGVGLEWATNGQLGFRVGSNIVAWFTDDGSGKGRITLEAGATDVGLAAGGSGVLNMMFGGSAGASWQQFLLQLSGDIVFDGSNATGGAGRLAYDTTKQNFGFGVGNASTGSLGFLRATLFSCDTSQTKSADNTTETDLLPSGTQWKTKANNWLAQRKYTIRASGFFSTDVAAPQTLRVRVKLGTTLAGATTILDTGAQTPAASMTNRGWHLQGDITCRTTGTTGTVFSQGFTLMAGATNTTPQFWDMESSAAITINTTIELNVYLSVTWGGTDTDNTITMTNGELEFAH